MKIGAHQIPKFDPFNMTGLPDHILPQIIDDYHFWYNDYAMREEFKLIDSYINKRRENHTPDPMLKEWLDQGLISQNQYDQVVLLRGGPSDVYSDIFSKPIGDIPVVPPDLMVPMSAPGSMDRLRHYEEGALDRTIKGVEFLPKVTAYAVGEDGVKRDLRDIDLMSILTGPVKGDYIPHGPIPNTNLCPEVYSIEGEHLDGEVDRIMQKSGLLGENGMLDLFKVAALSKRNVPIEGELVSPVMDLDENLNRRNYGILIRESLDSEGNVEYHLGEPKEKPLEGQIVDKGVLITVLGPEDGAWQAGKEELSQAIENGELESPPFVPKQHDGYKLDHIAPLPPATGTRPLVQQFSEIAKQTSQGPGRDETMAIYHDYHKGLEALEESIAESRSAGRSLLPKPDLTAGEVGDASAELAKIRQRKNPLREHWEKHGDPYEGRLPQPTPEQQVTIDQLLTENVDPELAERVKRRIRRESLGDLEDTSDAGLPPVEPTPEEIADAEQAMQEAADGKLDYLLEGTQWDPKLRK